MPFFSNRFLLISLIAVAIAHGAALYVPPMQRLLGFAPLNGTQWFVVLTVGLLIVAGAELDKLLARKHVIHEYA